MTDPFDDNNVQQTEKRITLDEGQLIHSLVRQIREMQRENQRLANNQHPFFKTVTWFTLGVLSKLTVFVDNYQKNQLEAERLWAEMVAEQRRESYEFILEVADRADSDAVMREREKRVFGFGGKSSYEESRDKFRFAEDVHDRVNRKLPPLEKPVLYTSVEPVLLLVGEVQSTINTMLTSIDTKILIAENESSNALMNGKDVLQKMQAISDKIEHNLGRFNHEE